MACVSPGELGTEHWLWLALRNFFVRRQDAFQSRVFCRWSSQVLQGQAFPDPTN